MARWQDAKMPRCQDAKMPRCQDAKMPRCQDARMLGCQDAKNHKLIFYRQFTYSKKMLRPKFMIKKRLKYHFMVFGILASWHLGLLASFDLGILAS
jgi:hypothetical protein